MRARTQVHIVVQIRIVEIHENHRDVYMPPNYRPKASSFVMNISLELPYGRSSRSLSKYDLLNPYFLPTSERTQLEWFPGAPVTITVVLSSAKLAKATIASGSVADEASTRKI
ncbi:hypothetical protein SLA2020_439860 [Shorea laevis]